MAQQRNVEVSDTNIPIPKCGKGGEMGWIGGGLGGGGPPGARGGGGANKKKFINL